MPSSSKQFEILVDESRRWSIVSVKPTKQKAIEEAKSLMREGRYAAVKVISSLYNEKEGNFSDTEVYFEGKRRGAAARKASGPVEFGPVCTSVGDLYGAKARLTIRKLLRDPLRNWHITPLELLHNPSHFDLLENTGTLYQSAVQRTAVSQVQATGQGVQLRVRELYKLVDEAAARLRNSWKKEEVIRIGEVGFGGLLEEIKAWPSREYAFNMAVAGHIADCDGRRAKLTLLLELLAEAGDGFALSLLDAFIAEYLDTIEIIMELLGEQPNPGGTVLRLADLALGRYRLGAEGIPGLELVSELLAAGKMPQCRDAIVRHIQNAVEARKPLRPDDLAAEVKINAKLTRRLTDDSGQMIGGDDMLDAIKARGERFLGAESVARFLEGVDAPEQRIAQLLSVEKGLIGGGNKRLLGQYIMPILTGPNNVAYFVKGAGPVMARLRTIRQLQKSIQHSQLQPFHKERMVEQLDKFCMAVIREQRLFEQIEKGAGGLFQKGMSVLRLCAADVLTDGEAAQAARNRARGYVKQPAFMDEMAESLRTGKKEEQVKQLLEFKKLLQAAGIQ